MIKEEGNYSYRLPNIAVYDYGIITDMYMEFYVYCYNIPLFLFIHNNWLMSCQWGIPTNMVFTDDTIQK